MDEVVEVHTRKFAFFDLFVHPNPENSEENLRQKRGKFADGPQQHVAQIGGHGEEGQKSVRIAFEKRFRQKFAREQHDEGRENRVERHAGGIVERGEERSVEKRGEKDAIDHEGDVVADEHRADETVGMGVEAREDALCETAFSCVDFGQKAVARHEGDFHSREKGGKHHTHEDSNQ